MDNLDEVMLKKAKGYTTTEIVEEYDSVDGEMSLQKKKVTYKEVPPDLATIKAIREGQEDTDEYETMSEEELNAERQRLIQQLKEQV